MANIQNLTNMGKGRPLGAKNKLRWNDVITDEKLARVIEGLYDIAVNGKYEKDRITASNIIVERSLGRIPQIIEQTVIDGKTTTDLLEDTEDEL
jgi:hypothetical protein